MASCVTRRDAPTERAMDGLGGEPGSLRVGDLRVVSETLWTIIAEKLRPAERDEVWSAISLMQAP